MLVYALSPVAARYDGAILMEGLPSNLDPADLPSRERKLPFDAEPKDELSRQEEIYALQRTQTRQR